MTRVPLTLTLVILLLTSSAAGPVWAASGDYRHATTIYSDDKGNSLSGPAGIACDGSSLVVADTLNSRLILLTYENGLANVTGEIKLLRQILPAIVQISTDGKILVYDKRSRDIFHFDPDGNRLGKVEFSEIPAPSRVIPKSFRVGSSGDLYLLDAFGRRVIVLDGTGRFKEKIAYPEEFGFFSDLAVDMAGRIYILDSVQSQVMVSEPGSDIFKILNEDVKDLLGYPTHIEVDDRGFLYIVDEESSSVVTLRRDGSFADRLFNRGRKEGLLYYPSQLCVGDGSQIVIADRDNNRVQVFREKE